MNTIEVKVSSIIQIPQEVVDKNNAILAYIEKIYQRLIAGEQLNTADIKSFHKDLIHYESNHVNVFCDTNIVYWDGFNDYAIEREYSIPPYSIKFNSVMEDLHLISTLIIIKKGGEGVINDITEQYKLVN